MQTRQISGRRLATETGLTEGYVSKVRNGLRPGPEAREKIAACLKVPESDLWEDA